MAKVLFGGMVADARGKMGGIVYSRNTAGAYVRSKVSPVQPRTSTQLEQRERLQYISKQWGALTQGQREAWKEFSLQHHKKNVFGLAKQRTAQQMFMFCNLLLFSNGLAILLDPPTQLNVNAVTSVGLVTTTSGAVTSVAITAAGTGYTSAPTVGFTGGGGSGAAATAQLTPTSVASATVTAPGTGYTTAPTVVFTSSTGIGAAGTATVSGGAVTGITITSPGSGYATPPTISFTGGGGSGATATAVLTATSVQSVTITNHGSAYTSAPTVSFTGGAGSGAAATASITTATTGLSAIWTPSPLPTAYEWMEMWCTGVYPVGRTFNKNLMRYLMTVQPASNSPLSITTAWTAVFGDLPIMGGYKIGIQARLVNSLNGARSEWASGVLVG